MEIGVLTITVPKQPHPEPEGFWLFAKCSQKCLNEIGEVTLWMSGICLSKCFIRKKEEVGMYLSLTPCRKNLYCMSL